MIPKQQKDLILILMHMPYLQSSSCSKKKVDQ